MSNRSTRKWLGFKLVVVTAAVMLVILGLAESDMVAAVFTVSLVVIIVMIVGFVVLAILAAFRRLGSRVRGMLGPGADASFRELDRMTGKEFESWIAQVLRGSGFAIYDTPHTGDFGVDVLCSPPGNPNRVAIQAKRYKSSVSNSAVQQAIAGAQYYDCTHSAVVTQSRYTRAARAQAAKADPPVLLIDRNSIRRMPQLLAKLAAGS
ncbi:MAG: hypothetical protein CMJ33_07650 [Phycisphaerae bacterium]|nr:hypothetical protein [Phycisphaerae bacterium]HAW96648.1 hypothetical protein [Phycisphaerales bacterium]|tara:strand:+ start:1625 stop:2245 length:621 start_codon:yes stop_codon:yes gene_type:complete